MHTENKLFKLDSELRSLDNAIHDIAENRTDRMTDLFLLGLAVSFVGVVALMASIKDSAGISVMALSGTVLLAGGVLLAVARSFHRTLGKRGEAMVAAKNEVHVEYLTALHEEMRKHGIDPDSVDDKHNAGSAVEYFTALVRGVPVDVNIERYAGKVLFMVRSEKMPLKKLLFSK